jgi:hypothetical protein
MLEISTGTPLIIKKVGLPESPPAGCVLFQAARALRGSDNEYRGKREVKRNHCTTMVPSVFISVKLFRSSSRIRDSRLEYQKPGAYFPANPKKASNAPDAIHSGTTSDSTSKSKVAMDKSDPERKSELKISTDVAVLV